jgi:hydrogenase expression/formation protein HypC
MCLAVPGRVTQRFDEHGVPMGTLDFGGVLKTVCLAYVPEIEVGDYAIVHVGFAISRIDEQAAQETLRTFEQLGLLQEQLEELRATEDVGPAEGPPQSP